MTPLRHDHATAQLFDDYLDRAGTRHRALEGTALRTESRGMRELLAHGASHGKLTLSELTASILAGDDIRVDPQRLASLARVCALQNFDSNDRRFAIAALAIANAQLPQDKSVFAYRILEVQLLLEAEKYDRVAALLSSTKGLRKHPELNADLANPFAKRPYADEAAWSKHFNQRIVRYGHEPVTVAQGPGQPIDRLRAEAPSTESFGLISVILTTHRPARHAILGSVMSILDQTWRDLELIVVDDASPPEYDSILAEVAALDERIALYRLPQNQGTYGARNFGLSKTRGIYITGQDDDDWSHPRRLEVQARALADKRDIPATRVASLAADVNLFRSRIGYGYVRENSSSLMFRRRWLGPMGGYLPARKAADNEFYHRLEAVSGQRVDILPDPLTIIRVTSRSLSADDYRPGWSHPARRSFRSAYTLWHRANSRLRVDTQAPAPIPVPRRLGVAAHIREEFDVVFAGDWRQYGDSQRSMLEEAAALRQRGLAVGVLHLEDPWRMSAAIEPLCAPVQKLINRGELTEVFTDDDAAVNLLILRHPSTLQFAVNHESQLKVGKLAIFANRAPAQQDGTRIQYRPVDCTRNATNLFGVDPVWIPHDPIIRADLEPLLPKVSLATFDMPGILDLDHWATRRERFRSRIPVIGRHSRDDVTEWPRDPSALRKAYPTDGSVDVRIMGGIKTPSATLGTPHSPPAWLAFESHDLPIRTFLNSLDYFVYYPHEQTSHASSRAILEAIAAGCVAVLPHSLETTFGNAALYAAPREAMPLIHELYANPQAHWRHVAEARQVLRERFSFSTYADRISSLLNQPAIASR